MTDTAEVHILIAVMLFYVSHWHIFSIDGINDLWSGFCRLVIIVFTIICIIHRF